LALLGRHLKGPRLPGTFERLVAERIRAWGVVGTMLRAAAAALVVFAVLYVFVIANPPDEFGGGNWRTTNFGSAIDDPRNFLITLLNGLTFAGLLFMVASGFALIFGLMRVINMAQGTFFLLGGYIAYDVQQNMAEGGGFTLLSTDVNLWEWVVPALVATLAIGVFGLVVQQVLLRWNQGQDLRQALITIALSVILADQIIEHFHGGLGRTVTWPGSIERFVDLRVYGIQYSVARLTVLGLGLLVGALLWVWLYRTRTGMVIRAGVDDRQMTSALGINIQRTFAIAFFVGSALAGFGGAVGATQAGAATGADGQWLLNSLVVVIIGGLGSLLGAAVGSLLYGLVYSFAAVYLPTGYTNYAIILTFALLALVLAFRPQGLVGRPG
jgi:branched-chain amino acid transport system permease protein